MLVITRFHVCHHIQHNIIQPIPQTIHIKNTIPDLLLPLIIIYLASVLSTAHILLLPWCFHYRRPVVLHKVRLQSMSWRIHPQQQQQMAAEGQKASLMATVCCSLCQSVFPECEAQRLSSRHFFLWTVIRLQGRLVSELASEIMAVDWISVNMEGGMQGHRHAALGWPIAVSNLEDGEIFWFIALD